jgi:hypothetical protein
MLFEEDMLLHGYMLWLQKKTKCQFVNVVNPATKQMEQRVAHSHWLYMPLGGCIYCMSWWIATIPAIFVCVALSMPLTWSFFVFIAIQALNFFFIDLQNKILS